MRTTMTGANDYSPLSFVQEKNNQKFNPKFALINHLSISVEIMRKQLTFLFLFLLCTGLHAGGNKFQEAMKSAITLLDSSKSPAEMIDAANRFERIGDAEKKEWLPYYYASF